MGVRADLFSYGPKNFSFFKSKSFESLILKFEITVIKQSIGEKLHIELNSICFILRDSSEIFKPLLYREIAACKKWGNNQPQPPTIRVKRIIVAIRIQGEHTIMVTVSKTQQLNTKFSPCYKGDIGSKFSIYIYLSQRFRMPMRSANSFHATQGQETIWQLIL